jgi:hypothetical protein
MATTAEAVTNALISTVKAITPTKRADLKFRALASGDTPDAIPRTSGTFRYFDVWPIRGQEGDFQHPAEAETRETFVIVVVYPQDNAIRDLRNLIRSDLHDIRVAVNADAAKGSGVLHQFVESWETQWNAQQGQLQLVVEVQVQFLESVS